MSDSSVAILAYISAIEFAKERTRQLAQRAVDKFTLEDPLGHIGPVVDTLINDIENEILPHLREAAVAYLVATGFDQAPDAAHLTKEIEDRATEVALALATAADAWAQALEDRLHGMLDSGISEETYAAATAAGSALSTSELAALFTILSDGGQAVVDSITSSVQDAYFATVPDDQLYDWVAVEDGRECKGDMATACAPRHGQQKTLTEWEKIGMPKSPHLNCSVWNPGRQPCRCVLVKAGFATPTPVQAAEALANARRSANPKD